MVYTIENDKSIIPLKLPIEKPSRSELLQLLEVKNNFIINEWLLKSPNSNINTIYALQQLVSTNKIIQKWYVETGFKYHGYKQMPKWVLGEHDLMAKWGLDNTQALNAYKISITDIESKREKAAKSYKDFIKGLNDEISSKKSNFIIENPILAIDMISIESLPADRAQEVFTVNPDKYKISLAEALLAYKKDLAIKFYNNIIKVDDLVKLLK